MNHWENYIDRAIRKAMEEGEFKDLPGEGKPLQWHDDPNTPDDMKLAYKILRENDLVPDWIVQGRELEAKQEQLLTRLKAALLSRASAADWDSARTRITQECERLNREIIAYNLKVPSGVQHRPLINLQREIDRLTG
jgi:hypothetical protein